jgi:signal transduction histidine kinase
MKRLLPKSMAGQLTVLLLAALVLSHVIGVLVFAGERRQAMRSVRHMELLQRTAAIVRLLEATSPDMRGEILRAVGSPRLRYWISGEPALTAVSDEYRDQWLADMLEMMLAAGRPAPARVHLTEFDRPEWITGYRLHPHNVDQPERPHEELGDNDDTRPPERRGARMETGLLLSVPLVNGEWLNAAARFGAPRVGWAWPTILSLLLAAMAILSVVILTVRRITRPLTALSAAAEKLGRGEAVEALVESGPAELRRTTAAFNAMRERLTRFVRDRTTMLAAISHDLRTPLTSLRLHAELVEDRVARGKLLAILEEMQHMTEATLAFAREEAAREDTRTIDMAALLESLCEDLAALGMEVAFAGAEKTPLACRPAGLKRAVRNLVENAVSYGERARVALEQSADELRIVIDDDGPGIAHEDSERVFGPFVRLEKSRSRDTGGIGLGMAIARSIVRAHGGDITLENRAGGGLRATVRLPREDS